MRNNKNTQRKNLKLKKGAFCLMCAAAIFLSATGCENNPVNENVDDIQTKYEVPTEYILEEYAKPLWEGNVITNESVMLLYSDDTAVLRKNQEENPNLSAFDSPIVKTKALLYPAEEIYAVYSYDMKTEYIKGKDWDLIDGKLAIYPNSAIPVISEEVYYPETNKNGAFESTVDGHQYILFGESTTMTQLQVVVTYRHSGTWEGPLPTAQSEKIKNFIKKLENGEEVTIVFYGDSITTGANSSGPMGSTPNAPSFAQIITEFIAKKYGYEVSKEADPFSYDLTETPLSGEKVIHYINTAVGGTTSSWGRAELEERVLKYTPDLMVLAFGMNEGGDSLEKFTGSISELIKRVQTECPQTETILVSTMLPHFRVKGFYGHQYQHGEALEELVANSTELDTTKVAIANVTKIHDYVLKFKEYYDMTGNNVNHPNDFLARLYTGTILGTMFGDYYN